MRRYYYLLPSSVDLIVLLIIIPVACCIFTVDHVYAPLAGSNKTQVWLDALTGVKIHFAYQLNKPTIKNLNELNFTIQDLNTNKMLKNVTGNFVVLNSPDPTFEFDNLTAPAGDFSIICPFLNPGTHQVIVKMHTANNSGLALASFRMIVPQNSS